MSTLPQLIEEDVLQLDRALRELIDRSEATTALIIDKGGFLITKAGETEDFDVTTIAALASGAYLANQTIANLIHEENFNSVYQQGDKFSMIVINVDEQSLLVTIFKAVIGVGAVKYFATLTAARIAQQMIIAQMRAPEAGLDLSVANLADASGLFKKR